MSAARRRKKAEKRRRLFFEAAALRILAAIELEGEYERTAIEAMYGLKLPGPKRPIVFPVRSGRHTVASNDASCADSEL